MKLVRDEFILTIVDTGEDDGIVGSGGGDDDDDGVAQMCASTVVFR